ncbi:MAG: cobalt-precorrin-5B (C(1))-methyltransferase CbiD [Nitrospiraceae bacterium]|nr:cobalt-precorrin-5B (C(1))-methyltransferase CbiD [Nitrospiraceae bacterium]
MASSAKKLRSGYTTGACAAAAAKAAVALLLGAEVCMLKHDGVEIPFPDGSRVKFPIHYLGIADSFSGLVASASVIKDAGDDPDVTNGAEIMASARGIAGSGDAGGAIVLKGGRGVGRATKPGLPIPVGEPAINPVPRKMIREAVAEALLQFGKPAGSSIEITISVPEGEKLAMKTLNARLGIIGGISILGTSGIVRPLSADAWTSSITVAMDVAKATGVEEIVLSVGRVSEKAHMKRYTLPVEAYVMMGDYFEFSLIDAKKHAFKRIHISAHWAKMLKISMSTPQTHVRHGAIDLQKGVEHLNRMGIAAPKAREFNTAREVYDYLIATYVSFVPMLREVCCAAKRYAEGITGGIPTITHLVSYEGEIIADSE